RLPEPAVLGVVVSLHDPVLAGRIHPADAQTVDPDAVTHDAECDILAERDHRPLRGAIGGNEALAAMARHRDDVDDRPLGFLAQPLSATGDDRDSAGHGQLVESMSIHCAVPVWSVRDCSMPDDWTVSQVRGKGIASP